MGRQQSKVEDLEMEVQIPNSHRHLHLPQKVVDQAFHLLHLSQRSFLRQSKKVRIKSTKEGECTWRSQRVDSRKERAVDSGAPVMLWNCAILSASEDMMKSNLDLLMCSERCRVFS